MACTHTIVVVIITYERTYNLGCSPPPPPQCLLSRSSYAKFLNPSSRLLDIFSMEFARHSSLPEHITVHLPTILHVTDVNIVS